MALFIVLIFFIVLGNFIVLGYISGNRTGKIISASKEFTF